MTERYTLREAWANACKEEGIPEDSKFAIFSDNNGWAKRYKEADQLYFKARQSFLTRINLRSC